MYCFHVFNFYLKTHNIYFRLRNKVEYVLFPRDFRSRIDTFPFLSSDGYSFCFKTSLMRNSTRQDLVRVLRSQEEIHAIYFPSSLAYEAAEVFSLYSIRPRLIVLGDDDLVFSGDELTQLFPDTKHVYATNLISENEFVRGIPLGLESPSYKSGGRLRDFIKPFSINANQRPISILLSWNTETNESARNHADSMFERCESAFRVRSRIAPQTFHRLLRKSLFVACPRGNGLDTHRIWETLYLGAVPIVLEQEYFPALRGWPIWVVESWSDCASLDREFLEKLYKSLIVDAGVIRGKSTALYEALANA